MMSNVSTTVATLSRPMGIVKPTRWGEKHSQAPLAGINRSSKRQLVERMEDNRDDLATWQWKPRKLVSAPFSRFRSRRVRLHPIAAAARIAARLALAAARSAASRAAASATKAALKHRLIARLDRLSPTPSSGDHKWPDALGSTKQPKRSEGPPGEERDGLVLPQAG
jgi:hypothetical protein